MIDYLNPNFGDLPGRRIRPAAYRRLESAAPQPVDVSVLTPFHNTEELFAETVASVLAQSLQNWEWIIVDDGSDDSEAVERLVTLTKDDARIKVTRQQNAGPAAARNRAFERSSGRYLCLLDSDDMLEPTYLEKCMWFLDSNPEFAFCNSYTVVFGEQEFLWSVGFERNKEHIRANSGPPISLVRREAFAQVGGFDETIRLGHEDWDFWLAMAQAGHWGYTIGEYLQWYRKRGGGRYEQILRSGKLNDDFHKRIARKYAGLKGSFPNPRRRPPEPFETVQTSWTAHNPLAPNPNGRRILFLVPWMVVGGADRVNLDLVEGLVQRGHDVTVCATLSADHRWAHKFCELTPDVFILPNILHLSDFPRFLSYLIETRHIDTVVITGSTIGYQLLPFLRAAAPRASFVDLCHVEEPHWLNGGHPRFGVGYQDALDLNVVTTGHLARWMDERGADPARIRLMYTGVRQRSRESLARDRQAVRARLGLDNDVPVLVFGGRICAQKRPAVLAAVLKGTKDRGLHFHALVVGEGELRPMLERRLADDGLQGVVTMLGVVPHDAWLGLLAASDILLLPSDYEGISVALLEAMAAGVVPVAARVGGQTEVVRESCGYLIPQGDEEVQDYVRVIERLVQDAGERQAKSRSCQLLVESEFSWEKTINDLERIMDEAQDAAKQQRCRFTLSIGRELASLALEYRRLGDAMDWSRALEPDAPSPPPGLRVALALKVVWLMRKTRVGRYLLEHPRVKSFGRRVLSGIVRSGPQSLE